MKEMWGCSWGFAVCMLQESGVHRLEMLENSWETWLHLVMGCMGWKAQEIQESLGWVTRLENSQD